MKRFPNAPGVYLHKDADDKIIYVGKAKNLKNRVASYYNNSDKSPKTQHLVKRIKKTEYIITDTEVEALLLENKLIKQHKPKYNIHLKDAKTFAYLKLTEHQFPRLITSRRITKKGEYFGPYTDGYKRREIQNLANKIFKLRTCKTLPKRECLNYHIGLCSAPCIENISKEDYEEQVSKARNLLKGDTKKIIEQLTEQMQLAASRQYYELALECKNQIEALEHLEEKQKVDVIRHQDQDVIATQILENTAFIVIMPIRKGVLKGKEQYSFEYMETVFEDFLTQYYLTRKIPHEIIINREIEDESILHYLESLSGRKVQFTTPQRGEKKKMLGLAMKNIVYEHEETQELQKALKLATTPRVIECFDISNLGREAIVAGMTRFVNGEADRQGYRRFLLDRTTQDDFASMREAVYRRYKRLQEENKDFPDLVLIDGGKGQLRAALDAMRELQAKIPVVSIAKREEELYVPGRAEPYNFGKDSKMMLYLRRIRDSTHKQAISYNRKRREMRFRDD